MRMSVRLSLPREVESVPAVRRLLHCALGMLHADPQAGWDLEIALTEACANVVKHAAGAENFEVMLDVADDRATIDVLDSGAGFDPDVAVRRPEPTADRGRGLFLIQQLSDNVRMDTAPRRGCVIHFEKWLGARPGRPASPAA